jgi:hypothetical protein
MVGMCHEPSSENGKSNNSMQLQPMEVHQVWNQHTGLNRIQLLGLHARRTLTVTCTLRICVVLTCAFIWICLSRTPEIEPGR